MTNLPSSPLECASIPSDEMGFAMALFASAANGSLSAQELSAAHKKPNRRCERLFMKLMCSDDLATTIPRPIVIKDDLSLYSVFRLLWERYESDERQSSICARVLAFHFLKARTAGAEGSWSIGTYTRRQHGIDLDPVIVEALANVRLLREGLIDEVNFSNAVETVRFGVKTHDQVQRLPVRSERDPACVSTVNPADLPFGQSESRLLAETLLTYETTLPGDHALAASTVHRKLHLAFASMVGVRGFQSWSERARTLTNREGLSLDLTYCGTDGALPVETVEGATAAAAFFGHLIALPDRLIGTSLMLRLLQDVWPDLLNGWQSPSTQ